MESLGIQQAGPPVGTDADQCAGLAHPHQRDQVRPLGQPGGVQATLGGDPRQLDAPGPLGEDVGHLARLHQRRQRSLARLRPVNHSVGLQLDEQCGETSPGEAVTSVGGAVLGQGCGVGQLAQWPSRHIRHVIQRGVVQRRTDLRHWRVL